MKDDGIVSYVLILFLSPGITRGQHQKQTSSWLRKVKAVSFRIPTERLMREGSEALDGFCMGKINEQVQDVEELCIRRRKCSPKTEVTTNPVSNAELVVSNWTQSMRVMDRIGISTANVTI